MKINAISKTISSFYKNGYRQWGVVANEVIERNRGAFIGVYSAYNVYCATYDENALIEPLRAFYKSVLKSGVLSNPYFTSHECMKSNGRRLGLIEIISRLKEL